MNNKKLTNIVVLSSLLVGGIATLLTLNGNKLFSIVKSDAIPDR